MKARLAIFCLLLLNFLNSKVYSQQWFDGTLVLADSRVLVGEISLERNHDVILFQHNESRMVYPAHKVRSIFFYDKQADINRRYISIKDSDGVRIQTSLYEVVIGGEVDVLRRIKPSAFSTHDTALDYNYFIYCNDVLTPIGKFRRKIYPHLQLRSDDRLERFISVNRLTPNVPVNAIRIIKYYNSIAKDVEPIARN